MACSYCGNQSDHSENFCRKCGSDLNTAFKVPNSRTFLQTHGEDLGWTRSKDPDELTGNGIGSVIMGDGILMVAVILGATNTTISSLLWLLLLIPAFFFFGKGFSDVLHARQIRRRMKALGATNTISEPRTPRASIAEVVRRHTSGDLLAAPSVTERTTRQLK